MHWCLQKCILMSAEMYNILRRPGYISKIFVVSCYSMHYETMAIFVHDIEHVVKTNCINGEDLIKQITLNVMTN